MECCGCCNVYCFNRKIDSVVVVVGVVHYAVLVEIAQADRIIGLVGSAGEVQRVGSGGRRVDELLVPVGTARIVGRIAVSPANGVPVGKIEQFHVLFRVAKLHDVHRHLDTCITVIADAEMVVGTLLGGDENDSVCSAHTVDGGSGSILEHGQGFDVVIGEEVDVVHKGAIDDVKRGRIVSDGTHATHLDARLCRL